MSVTEDFQKKIESKIAELEKQSSVEFVPLITARSSSYGLYRVTFAVGFLCLSLLLLVVGVYFEQLSSTNLARDVLIAVLVTAVLWWLSGRDGMLSALLPTDLKHEAV